MTDALIEDRLPAVSSAGGYGMFGRLLNRLHGKMQTTKEDARGIREPDFIPGGRYVDIDILCFRRTGSSEIFRCCRQTDSDIQSGPFYCGDIAEYVAPTEGGTVALCERYAPPNHLLMN